MTRRIYSSLAPLLVLVLAVPFAAANGDGVLRAGAARIDITPSAADMPKPFQTVHDPLFVRALVVDDGVGRAALVVADVPAIQADIHADLVRRVAELAGVPLQNVMLAASHTHNAPRVAASNSGGIIAGSDAFTQRVTAATVQAVRQALAGLRPVRVGYGDGQARLTANRNQWSAREHRYVDGIDRSGTQFVDHGLGVMKFATPEGDTVALLLNYGIEPVVDEAQPGEISGDVPGAAARYVEQASGGHTVALFTISPAASPLYRVWARPAPSDPRDAERAHGLLNAMGTLLGEEALATARDIGRLSDRAAIRAGAAVLQCPGKVTTPQNLARECSDTPGAGVPACRFQHADGPPVALHYGVLKLGEVALVHADANVVPTVGATLKRAAPVAHAMVVLDNFGPFRFLVDDASYPLNTYEATATRARPGCGEEGLVDGVARLLERMR